MCTERSLSVKISKEKGESARVFLRDLGLLRTDLRIKRNKEVLFIPVKQNHDLLKEFELVSSFFQKIKKEPRSYQELLDIPLELYNLLPTSFDIIGDILILRLPEELHSYSASIGDALLKTHAHVKTVCLTSPVSGDYRTRSVSIIAGRKQTMTKHKEYGSWFNVDVKNTYFSPRLASERKRVSMLIKKDSFVFDMFCGVGPFSILIARYAKPCQILAIDTNTIAVELARTNAKENKVDDLITVINEDAKDTSRILQFHKMIPDHIIMNLPFSAFKFFPLAVQHIADKGMIHYYDIIEEAKISNRCEQLERIAKTVDATLDQMRVHRIKTYAPHEFYIGIDITVSKN